MKRLQEKIRDLVFIASLYFAIMGVCYAQIPHLSFNHLTPKDQLTNPYNAHFYKDSRGLMWISSIEGLYCFDGLSLKTYLPTDNNGLLNKDIQSSFFEDTQGDIWFTTIDGINCYRRVSNTFDTFFIEKNGKQLNENYHLFHLERDSILWLKAAGVIYKHHIHTQEQDSITTTGGFRFAVDTFSNGGIKTIIACPAMKPGVEWISFASETLEKNTFFSAGLPPDYTATPTVYDALIEKDTLIWLFSNVGLIKFNPLLSEQSRPYQDSMMKTPVVDGVRLNDSQLLTVTMGDGLWIFNKKDQKFKKRYLHNPDQADSPTSNSFISAHLDKQNHLWLGNLGKTGVDECWMEKNRFDNPFARLGIDFVKITSIIKDKKGLIWCATQKKGIFVFNKDGDLVDKFETLPLSSKVENEVIRQFTLDDEQQLWANTQTLLSRFHQGEWKIVYEKSDRTILSIFHLSSKTKIVATDNGVFKISIDTATHMTIKQEMLKGGEKLHVFRFFAGEANRIYAPSDGHLLIYQQEGENVTLVENILIKSDVYDILELPNEAKAYLATNNGLLELDTKTFQFTNFFQGNKALENVQIYSISADKNKNWWLTTDKAVWQYQVGTKQLLKYQEEDGLSSNQFSFMGNVQGVDSTLWLIHNKGIAHFHPDSIQPYPYAPNIRIASLKVNNQLYQSNPVIDELPFLELLPEENNLQFVLQGVTNYLPKLVRVFYRFRGYEEAWRSVENGGVVNFPQIPDNRIYQLEMYGVNANGVRSGLRILEIGVAPPFWKTWQFWALVFVGLLGLGYLVFLIIIRRKLAEQEAEFERQWELEQVVQKERNRIAADMHDDLGGRLNSIQTLLLPIQEEELSGLSQRNLTKIEKYAQESMENMRIMVWTLNSSYDNLPTLASYTRRYIVEFFDDYEILCKANISPNLPDIKMSGKKRRNLFLSVKETVHNIVKHAKADQVQFSFKYVDHQLIIVIKDNGQGIDLEQINPFSNGLRNMRIRMDEIGGRFTIENKEGTVVTFEVPLVG